MQLGKQYWHSCCLDSQLFRIALAEQVLLLVLSSIKLLVIFVLSSGYPKWSPWSPSSHSHLVTAEEDKVEI